MVESVRLDTWLAVRKWDLPVLVLLAGQEKIVDNARTRAWADRRLRKKQVIEYPGAYHTLEFEPDTTWRDHFLAWLGNVK
jgi:alpha-beta hydrolase superfamily lysophospholipase